MACARSGRPRSSTWLNRGASCADSQTTPRRRSVFFPFGQSANRLIQPRQEVMNIGGLSEKKRGFLHSRSLDDGSARKFSPKKRHVAPRWIRGHDLKYHV